MIHALSVIIPLASDEQAWPNLRQDLQQLPNGTEIIWVSQHPIPNHPESLPQKIERWIQAPVGRANALNAGAEMAKHPWLWFLHADTRFSANTLDRLTIALNNNSNAIHYFNLVYADSHSLKLNAAGAWLRSHILGLPFGDQGFCMHKTVLSELNGYPEHVDYGEDHILMWRAKRFNIKVHCTGGSLITSGRKYQQHGWFRTTLKHQYLWIKQVLTCLSTNGFNHKNNR